ncbi:hypothetical protein L1987_01627 [Smallanthus sonchifolius]|uniref:Uncharacterized protein n=1 Tax=Smallanthus sonchifolius TaxID=185202 RepID=A0ACB9K5H3_9ASTR|nr:hypothetical protein L1987_01627 [Smallanthus sonchifolius]
MDDDSDRSSEATQFEIVIRERKRHGYTDDAEDSGTVNEDEFDDEATVDQREVSDLETSPMEIEEYSTTFQSETLLSGLADVPIHYEVRHDELEHLKNHLQRSHQEALAVVIAQAHAGNHMLGDQKVSSGPKTVSTSRTVKTPIDVYNWRKYGQKQVKSPKGSRSYFKCTYNECDAKKIESCDQYNSVTKIVYRGQHKHDPPKKVYTRRDKVLSANSRGPERKMISTLGSKQHKSSGSVSNGPILVEEMDVPPQKPRVKKSSSESPGSVLKPPEKPKFVIHAASDVGISADGYRWRKYGQKMVKGNPHPRNYYKCTSAGCPVRKHIEMAVDGSSEVVLTYKGIHDHDMPIPTKDQAPPTVLTVVSSPSKNNSQSNKGETVPANRIKIKIKP